VFLRERIQELVVDLGMRNDRNVVIAFRERQRIQALWPFRIFVGGKPCRQRAERPVSDGLSLAADIAEAIFENRDLLILESEWARCLSERLKQESHSKSSDPTAIDEVLKICIALGHGLPSIARFAAMLDEPADWSEARRGFLTPNSFFRTGDDLASQMVFELLVSPDLEAKRPELTAGFATMGEQIFQETGIDLPQLRISGDRGLAPGQIRARFNELRGPVYQTSIDAPSSWFGQLKDQVVRYAPLLVSNAVCEYGLGKLNQAFPMLVFNLIETKGIAFFAGVARELCAERVSIRDLRSVLDALLSVNGVGPLSSLGSVAIVPPAARIIDTDRVDDAANCNAVEYADYVRTMLRNRHSQSFSVNGRVISHRISSQLEEMLLSGPRCAQTQEVHETILLAVQGVAAGPGHALVTSSAVARRRLRELVSVEFADLPILYARDCGDSVEWVEGPPIAPHLPRVHQDPRQAAVRPGLPDEVGTG
jgi:hypothetical protein